MRKVERPKAEDRKIHCRDEFELCYLRHQYIRKVDFNPSEKDMMPYYGIASQQARNTFFTYINLFGAVGIGLDDIVNIARVHIISYLGLFAIGMNREKRDEFVKLFEQKHNKTPLEEDFDNKNKANFTLFLKQRMEDLVRVCRQKVRNIKGLPGEEHYIYVGPTEPPKILAHLMDNHENFGFRKLDVAVFKTIRKRAKAHGENVFSFNGLWYVSLKCEHKTLDLVDFAGAGLDPYDSIHNMSPERIYFDHLEEEFWEEKRVEFDSYDPTKRAELLKNFVSQNQSNPKFKAEVKLARKMIRQLGV